MKLIARQPGFVILSSLCLFLGLWSYTAKAQPRCANETHCVSLVTSQPFTQLFGHVKTRNQLLLTGDKVDMSTYDKYRALFNKVYSSKNEINRRFELFKQRVKYIIDSNLNYLSGKQPFSLGINKFTDLELGEFQDDDESTIFYSGDEPPLANGKDYRSTNCVTSVKNQGICGSCYAFATIGVIESMICLNPNLNPEKKVAENLSVSEVVDCFVNSTGHKSGCVGGDPYEVFEYFIKSEVALKDTFYPYKEYERECKRDDIIKSDYRCIVNLKDEHKKLERVKMSNYSHIMAHFDQIGPVAILFYATNDLFSYRGGILIEKDETKRDPELRHATILVGYGHEDGMDYWLVKNSWGSKWASLGGYYKVIRGKDAFGIESNVRGLVYI